MMYIAFNKATWGNRTLLDNSIDLFSGLKGFSHVELVFSDGVSFSSTTYDRSYDLAGRPKKDGTRFKRIDYTEHPERWTLVEIPVTQDQEHRMRMFAQTLLDARYDYWGCAWFVLPICKHRQNQFFCSEVVTTVLQHVELFIEWGDPYKVSPNRMWTLLKGSLECLNARTIMDSSRL